MSPLDHDPETSVEAHLAVFRSGGRTAELAWHLIRDHNIELESGLDTLDPRGIHALHEVLHEEG